MYDKFRSLQCSNRGNTKGDMWGGSPPVERGLEADFIITFTVLIVEALNYFQ